MAEAADRFVKKLNFSSGNVAAEYKVFKDQLAIYRIARKYSEMSEEEQIANTLLLMGSESVPIYQQFVFDDEVEAKKKTLENVLSMFGKHFEPVKNITYERVKFNSIVQGDSTIHQFITNLQTQADVCEYGTMREELVKDRIVVGVRDTKLREYLIDVDNLDLQKCIQKAKQFVSHHEHSAKMNSMDMNVDVVDKRKETTFSKPRQQQSTFTKQQAWRSKCIFCFRGSHKREHCPARNSICRACHLRGHWAKTKACKEQVVGQGNAVTAQEVTEEVEDLFLGSESD